MDSLAFLEKPGKGDPQPVYVLHGDEDFLKRRVLAVLRSRILGEGEAEFSFSSHAGDKASFATVVDELGTLPFLSQHRLVAVENADPFVTKNRAALEKYVTAPAARGVLVLDVRTWPSNTKLAKLVSENVTLVCKCRRRFGCRTGAAAGVRRSMKSKSVPMPPGSSSNWPAATWDS